MWTRAKRKMSYRGGGYPVFMPSISIYGMFAGHNLAADTRLIEHFFWMDPYPKQVSK